jgi:LemA protein
MRQRLVTLSMSSLLLGGCGYNALNRGDEQVQATWAEVVSQYQRRAGLIPNLLDTVKAEVRFEQESLTRVVEARSRATAIPATPELLSDPEALQRFQQAQKELTGALARLMVVTEHYPGLRANQAFRDLQAQLEGTETRIAVARNRHIQSVRDYNVTVKSFPSNLTAMAFDFKARPTFTASVPRTLAVPPATAFGASSASGTSR